MFIESQNYQNNRERERDGENFIIIIVKICTWKMFMTSIKYIKSHALQRDMFENENFFTFFDNFTNSKIKP